MMDARARTTDKRYYGVAEAIVVDVMDPEDEGRIKVKYPWFDDRTVTEWVRVRQLYAGNGYGTFFIPEVDDEVLVAFIHGDMRLPIILGGLYNGMDKPPSHRSEAKDEKLIRTKAGHRILLNDSKDKHQLELRTAGGHVADLSDEKKKISVTTTGGHLAEMNDADKKVTVKTSGGHQVEMDDQRKKITIKTSGGQRIEMNAAAGSITIEGASVTLDSQSISLGGVAAIEPLVLGNLFMAMFNAHTHITTLPTLPTGPPVPLMTPAVLSKTTKTS